MAVVWKKVALVNDAILKTVLDTKGDLLYRNEAGNPAGLAIVTNGHVLRIASSVPVWDDPPTPGNHAASHKHNGVTDVLALSDLSATAAVNFNGKEAKDLVVYNKTTPPATPVLGKWYYDTDTDVGLYICTSIA